MDFSIKKLTDKVKTERVSRSMKILFEEEKTPENLIKTESQMNKQIKLHGTELNRLPDSQEISTQIMIRKPILSFNCDLQIEGE